MQLRVLQQHENKNDSLFQSANCQTLLEMYEAYYPQTGFHVPWVAYLILEGNQVLGSCGFTGQPKNGQVEIAYWTFKAFEGRGVASFACQQLIHIAHSADPKITITAKTAPEHNASTKILEKNSFRFKEVVQDEEIGDAWLWVLEPQNPV